MTSILLGTVRVCCSLFKCNYVENKKRFFQILLRLWNLHQILNIFQKKMIVIANVFPRLQTLKTLGDHSPKSAVSEHPVAGNM